LFLDGLAYLVALFKKKNISLKKNKELIVM
jgi:predicted HTH domain antitoxin